MKVIISILLFSFWTQTNWVEDIDILISTIDSNAKVVASKNNSDGESIIKYTKSKLYNNIKTLVILESKDKNTFDLEYTVYQNNNVIIAQLTSSIETLFYKGATDLNRPKSLIKESRKYFKNDSIGIEYLRQIDVFENQNIDSLKLELQKKPFEKKPLDNVAYIEVEERLQRMRKIK